MAFNTPFKMWKRYEFNGGTADPCIISWPSATAATAARSATSTTTPSTSCRPSSTCWVSRRRTRSRDSRAVPVRRGEHALQLGRPVRAVGPQDAVLLHARLAGDLARGLEGGHHPPDDQRLEPLQRRHLGAVPHRYRPGRGARPGRRAPGQAAGDGEPVVRRGRRQRRVPARRPVPAGGPQHAPAAAGQPARPLRLLPRHRRRPRGPGGERPQPLLHHRRARSTYPRPARRG